MKILITLLTSRTPVTQLQKIKLNKKKTIICLFCGHLNHKEIQYPENSWEYKFLYLCTVTQFDKANKRLNKETNNGWIPVLAMGEHTTDLLLKRAHVTFITPKQCSECDHVFIIQPISTIVFTKQYKTCQTCNIEERCICPFKTKDNYLSTGKYTETSLVGCQYPGYPLYLWQLLQNQKNRTWTE